MGPYIYASLPFILMIGRSNRALINNAWAQAVYKPPAEAVLNDVIEPNDDWQIEAFIFEPCL